MLPVRHDSAGAVAFELLVAAGSDVWPISLRDRLSSVVPVPQGYVVVPLTEDLKERTRGDDDQRVLGLDQLTSGIAVIAAEASQFGPVVYAHQETFGGNGSEAAVVWHRERIAFGPLFTANNVSDRLTEHYVLVSSTTSRAIKRALRYAGVYQGDGADEYAAIDLDRHRTTNDWLAHRPGPASTTPT